LNRPLLAEVRLDSRRWGRARRAFLLTERLPRFLLPRRFFSRSGTRLRSSRAALGEVSNCAPLFSSTFVDVIHAERPLKVEQRRFKTHTRRLSMETQWILIHARGLSVGRSYQLVSPFYCFCLFQRGLLKSAAHLRVPRVFFFFFFFFFYIVVGPVRFNRVESVPTWLDLLTLSSVLYPSSFSSDLCDLQWFIVWRNMAEWVIVERFDFSSVL